MEVGGPARPGEVAPATLRRRLVATLVDLVAAGLLAAGAVLLLDGLLGPDLLAGVALVATSVPTYLAEAATGRSLGKAALQLRHTTPQQQASGDGPHLAAFFLRWAAKWLVPGLLALVGPAGWTWAGLLWVVDGAPVLLGRRRALHDLLAGTVVLEVVVTDR